MKNLLLIFAIFIIQTARSQNKITCPPESYQQFLTNIIRTNSDKEVFEKNWSQYFGDNLDQLPADDALNSANIVDIKLDAVGCVYPINFNVDFYSQFENQKKYLDVRHATFQSLYFGDTDTRFKFRDVVLKRGFSVPWDSIPDTGKYLGVSEEFINKWNTTFMPEKIQQLDHIISKNSIKNIVIFIHGYAVPYSLAVIQGNEIFKKYIEIKRNTKETLFVHVLWPSGSRKDLKNSEKITYQDIENFGTVKLFNRISNNAYLAATTLRDILSKLNMSNIKKMYVVSHSSGATVATSTFINTQTKLNKCGDSQECLTTLISKKLSSTPFPKCEVKIFINAPSIPGELTFMDVFKNGNATYKSSLYHWTIGYNFNDMTLNKQKLPLFKSKKLPLLYSNTTLGCDFRNDVAKSQGYFLRHGNADNFLSFPTSFNTTHDFFCYLQQPEYNTVLANFFSN